jgi:hypothetical protein
MNGPTWSGDTSMPSKLVGPRQVRQDRYESFAGVSPHTSAPSTDLTDGFGTTAAECFPTTPRRPCVDLGGTLFLRIVQFSAALVAPASGVTAAASSPGSSDCRHSVAAETEAPSRQQLSRASVGVPRGEGSSAKRGWDRKGPPSKSATAQISIYSGPGPDARSPCLRRQGAAFEARLFRHVAS